MKMMVFAGKYFVFPLAGIPFKATSYVCEKNGSWKKRAVVFTLSSLLTASATFVLNDRINPYTDVKSSIVGIESVKRGKNVRVWERKRLLSYVLNSTTPLSRFFPDVHKTQCYDVFVCEDGKRSSYGAKRNLNKVIDEAVAGYESGNIKN